MLKTTYIFISLLILFSSCKEENLVESKKKSFYYQNSDCYDDDSNKVLLELEEIKSYAELMNRMDSIACIDKFTVIKYQNESSVFHLIPSHKCPNHMIVCCYKARNRLKFTNDSIYSLFNSHPMDSLDSMVKKHLLNNGVEYHYSSSPRWAFFQIEMDSLITIEKLSTILIGISESFNEVNSNYGDSLSLSIRIGVEKIKEIRPPPPPPKTHETFVIAE